LENDVHSPRFWIRQWQEAAADTPQIGAGGYASRRIWDQMAADYERWNARGAEKKAAAEELIAVLSSRGLFREGMRVLDVGCGTGRLAMAFAARGAEVTALDFSPAMLRRLHEALPAELAGRVHLVEADWEELDLAARGWERAFDLVLACMTPAVRTSEEFLKLHRASRGGCCFRGWAGRREDPLLESLWRHLTGNPMHSLAGATTGVYAAFNLLYAMGCPPSVEFQEVSWEKREPVEKAASFFTDYFDGLDGLPRRELGKRISEYLAAIAEDGCVIRRTKGRTGIMTWGVGVPPWNWSRSRVTL